MPQPANRRTRLPSQLGRPQRDPELAVAAGVHPAHRPGVPAAVHALDLRDHLHGHLGRRAPDGGGGVQCRRELEHAGAVDVVDDAGDVGGQVHHVRQVQDERRLRHVHRRAVRRQGVGDRADGVLVLLEVLRGPRQRGGQGEVVLVVAGTPDRAGQHPGGDQAALASHQQLRRRTEEPVDVEGPAHVVLAAEPAQRPADVDRFVGRGDQVAGQHHLLQLARVDAEDRLPDDRPPSRRRDIAPSEKTTLTGASGAGCGARSGRASTSSSPIVVTQHAVTAAADDHAGDDQHAVARLVGEREAAQADQPGAGHADLVAATAATRTTSRHHVDASSKRVAPRGPADRGRLPKPTMPSPRRSQAIGWSVGSSSSSGPGSLISTVRATSAGERQGGALSVTRVQPTPGAMGRPHDQ